jgi:hypothetical protein
VLRKETNTAIENYLAERSSSVPKDRLADPDLELQPPFVGISKAGKITGSRLAIRDLNRTVDKYLAKAALKLKGMSCHALSVSMYQCDQFTPFG